MERGLDVVRPQAPELRERFIREEREGALPARVCERQAVRVRVAREVRASLELPGDAGGEAIDFGRGAGLLRAGGDDERAARLVDEHAVRLVDHCEGVSALDRFWARRGAAEEHFVKARVEPAGGAHRELVAQVVEAELRADAVGHIAGVSGAFQRGRGALGEQAGGEAEPLERRLRKLEVARGEIGIHRGHVRAASLQGKDEGGQQGDERLALAGGHFRKTARGECEAGLELAVVGAQRVCAADGLGDERDGVGGETGAQRGVPPLLAERGSALAEL